MSGVTIHLEPLVMGVRAYDEGKSFEAGDPYAWCATAVLIAPKTLEIKLTKESPTPEQYHALQRDLWKAGYRKVIYHRRRADGTDEVHEAPTHQPTRHPPPDPK